MIEVRNISKSFNGHAVLSNVSLSLEKGMTNLIIGQSGSGKTVLMKCMVGLHEVDSGQIQYGSQIFTDLLSRKTHSSDIMRNRRNIRKEIGMMFQGGALFDSMTVEENVKFPLTMFTEMEEEEKCRRANFCLRRVNLEKVNHLYPAEISGGMKKRVAIARAIALNPKYLFCDEPNSGLDPITAIVIDKLIHEITCEYGITTVINTHDMNSVMGIGDKVIFIYEGKKWWEGTKQEILQTENKELNEFVFANKFLKRQEK